MLKDALKAQIAFVDMTVQANLDGVSHEDSLRSAAEGGNTINWVLGHMIHTRAAMLSLLGGEPQVGQRYGALYGRRSSPLAPGDDCEPLDALRETWRASQAALLEKLEAADEARLAASVPGLFEPEKQEPVGVQLASLVFHESYHAGQLGVIRRNAGLEPAIA